MASFPTTVKDVLLELSSYASGDFKDESIRVPRPADADYSGFEPLPATPGIEVPGLLIRADRSAMADGWRMVTGAFALNGDMENAALLISPDLKIVRAWTLDEIPVDELEPRPKFRKLVHGLDILRDGSVIFAFEGGMSLQRFNSCGERDWTTGGGFHHSVTLDDAGETVWTFNGTGTIAQVAVGDGAILREISMDAVIAANPTIDILELRRLHPNDWGKNTRNTEGEWMPEKYHFNDVDPLPATMAASFDGFRAGDLLLSARSLNMVFVLDPESLEIKWWRIGETQRQHDPDWLSSGEIAVLNNRMSRDFSEIVAIDPVSFRKSVLFDGRDNDFYTRIRGKGQILDNGDLIVTSPQQARAFEVDRQGEVVFEVVNLKPDSETVNYVISELKWLPRDYFEMEAWKCPLAN
ncbi:arylsulfotransferase family protein [Oceanibacterium hippocampi]|uniref:arylsulfotransferase family protein n=1 Tax=Oceanibacterium hippocampi TaxID=745714 RepID=UPI001593576F|nr:arylsulfotransferase family protein [Oceanibacterium hippocampi]